MDDPARRDSTAPPKILARVAGEVRYGIAVALHARLDPPPEAAHTRRFLYGFGLPFGVLRAVLRDPAARRAYLRMASAQLVTFLLAGVAVTLASSRLERVLNSEGTAATLLETLALLSWLYAALCIIEWIVIALSRDYHDQLSHVAAELTGVPGEPLSAPPRVRLDVRWCWTKAKRKVREVLLFASGMPLLAIALAVPVIGDELYALLTGLWAIYWAGVFAYGNAPHAWLNVDPKDPWFLRVLAGLAAIPVIGWPVRLYMRLWRRVIRSVRPVCVSFERGSFEAAGLALARASAGLPGVYLFLRPFFPVAATHAFLARHDLPASPEPPAALPRGLRGQELREEEVAI